MTIVDLVRTEARSESRELIVVASLAGVGNALIMSLVNRAAIAPAEEKTREFIMIGLAVALYVVCARRTFHRTTAIIESALEKLKLRLIDKIEVAELQEIEGIGTSLIYDRLTENISAVSDAAGHIANVLQSLCIVICASVYILTTSVPAFALLALLSTVGILLWSTKNHDIRAELKRAARERVVFLDLLTDLLKGFKEVRFSRKRTEDIRRDIATTSGNLRVATVVASNMFNDNHVLSQCVLFALLVSVAFVLPVHVTLPNATIVTLVGGVLFFWGPLGNVVGSLPMYVRSNAALEAIETLEKQIDRSTRGRVPTDQVVDPWRGNFKRIDARQLAFAYPPDSGGQTFRIGPMSLSFVAGEVIFIVGGNGSGKSTFMKALSGLYSPSSGELRVDDRRVGPENIAAYREMYSAIFSDFHLFSRLYGLLDVDAEAVRNLLRQMQIDDKTSFEKGSFTRRDLSTGQRKRLAMIVALLEDRPIFLFDEWAADQDPEFRRYFYEDLIPSLKRRGKTILAVSHDDRYFDCADRVVVLEDGKIRNIDMRTPLASIPSTLTETGARA